MSKAKFSTRLRQVADIIEQQPEMYDQDEWGVGPLMKREIRVGNTVRVLECGTRHCIAGWLAVLEGMHPSLDVKENLLSWTFVSTRPGATTDDAIHIAGWARERFLLSVYEADLLFHPDVVPRDEGMSLAEALRAVADGRSTLLRALTTSFR